MTIAAGFVSTEGIILCADTQETIPDYIKNSTEKIKVWQDDGLYVVITGAGQADCLETATRLIMEGIRSEYSETSPWFPDKFRGTIQETCLDFFKTFLLPYPKDERPYVDLLIGIATWNGEFNNVALFKASGTTVQEIDPGQGSPGAECVGTGLIIAKSLVERLYSPFLNLDELLLVAAYIVFHAKRWADGCGGETDMFVLSRNICRGIHRKDITQLEHYFEEFDGWMHPLVEPFVNINVSATRFTRELKRRREQILRLRKTLLQSNLRVFEILKEIKQSR